MAGLDQHDQEGKVPTNYDTKSRVPKRKEREKNRRLPLTGIKTYKQEKRRGRGEIKSFQARQSEQARHSMKSTLKGYQPFQVSAPDKQNKN